MFPAQTHQLVDFWKFHDFLEFFFVSLGQFVGMSVLLVLATVGAVGELFATPIAIVGFDLRVLGDQMFLVGLRALELRVADLAGVADDVAVLQHVLFQGSFGVQPQAAFGAVIFSLAVRVQVLRQGAGGLVALAADRADVAFEVRVDLLVLLERSFLKMNF